MAFKEYWENTLHSDICLVLVADQADPARGAATSAHGHAGEQAAAGSSAGRQQQEQEEGQPVAALATLRVPAHAVIVCAKSSYLKARIERTDSFADAPAPAAASVQSEAGHELAASAAPEHVAVGTKRTLDDAGSCDRPMPAAQGLQPLPGQRVLVERGLTPQQLPLARAAVRYMYTKDFEEDVSGDAGQLCGVLVLADRFGAPSVAAGCVAALAALPTDTLSAEDMSHILDALPPAAKDCAAHEQLLATCSTVLLREYGDVQRVLSTPQLLASFCQLSFHALDLWAGLDDLTVDAEASVVALITAWFDHQADDPMWELESNNDLWVERSTCLTKRVRMCCLDTFARLVALPNLSWFHAGGRGAELETVDVILGSSTSEGCDKMKLVKHAVDMKSVPSAWVAAARKQLSDEELEERGCMEWQVPLDVLRTKVKAVEEDHGDTSGNICSWSEPAALAPAAEAQAAQASREAARQQQVQPSSALLQYLGYQWYLQVEVRWDEAAKGVIGGVFLFRRPPFGTDVTEVPAVTDFTIWSRKATDTGVYGDRKRVQGPVSSAKGYGFRRHFGDTLSSAAPDIHLGSFVSEGQLWIKVQVTAVG